MGDLQLTLIAQAQDQWLRHNSAEAHHECDTCSWYEQTYWVVATEEERNYLDDIRTD